jgi:NAD(P)-dependent dehydrogenase (short-subunit alcohol dehydrogenase family)
LRVVITGTSSGIGRQLAAHLLEKGHEVWGIARRETAAPAPARYRHRRCDLGSWPEVEKLAREMAEAEKSIDALVLGAGSHGPIGPAMDADPEAWWAGVQASLAVTYFPLRALFGLLRRSPHRAKVVCFSGGGATGPRPNFSSYASAKAGLVRLVETLAGEWSDLNIDVNAVAPGALPTPLLDELRALGPERVGAHEYKKVMETFNAGETAAKAQLAKVNGLVDFLLSPDSDGLSGRLISALWDDWTVLASRRESVAASEWFTLRRVTPP